MKSVAKNHPSKTADLVGQVADEFFKAVEAGQQPSVEEYVSRYPEIAAILRDVLPTLTLINDSVAGGDSNGKSTEDLSNKTLGDFRLIREIGRGGMGIVYEAEQISLGRTVAIKVLPFAGVLDEKQLHRFKNEARAAATLEHPHIVPVYSVGCERGVHFYAMRFIDGQSLADVVQAIPAYRASEREVQIISGNRAWGSADSTENNIPNGRAEASSPSQSSGGDRSAARLSNAVNVGMGRPSDFNNEDRLPGTCSPSSETRPDIQAVIATDADFNGPAYFRNVARLSIQAAEALAFAHEQGILHRDIKPGNLLIDVHGNLWVADFGLARLEQDAGVTVSGDVLGTLRYMSPEQALGKCVLDERSDVYSLGITLYEMLALRPAFSGRNRQEVLRRVATEDPNPPRQINPRIPRELETIVIKSICKEPAGRYQTASQLADDLQRYLDDQPIHARRPTLSEKCVKWSRRHPAAVLSAVIVAMVISIVSVVAALLINDARNDAVVAQDKALKLADEKSKLADAERQSRERADEQSQLALKTLKLVHYEIQTKLKGVRGAAEVRRTLLNTAIDGLKQLARNQSTVNNASHTLVRSHLDLGDAFYLTREIKSAHGLEEALAQFQAAHDIAVKLVDRLPHSIEVQRDLSIACGRMGEVNLAMGKVTAARDFFQKELDISQRLVDENPQNTEVRGDLAVAYQFMGAVNLRMGNVADTRSDFQRFLEISRKLADENPTNASAQMALTSAYQKLGDVNLKLANLPAARDAFQKELEIERKLAQDDEANVGLQDSLTMSYRRLGNVELQLGNVKAARDACQKAVAISQRLVGTDPESGFRRGLSIGYEYLGDVDLQLGDIAAAGEAYRKFVEISEKLAQDDPNDTESQRALAISYKRLGLVNVRLVKLDAAREAYQRSLEISEKLARQDPNDSQAQRDLALSYERLGDVNLQSRSVIAARDAYEKFSQIIRKLAQDDPHNAEAQRDLSVSYNKLSNLNLQLGDVTAARDACEKGLAIRQKLAQKDPFSSLAQGDLARSYEGLGDVYLRLGETTAAREACQKGLEIRQRMVQHDPNDIDVRRAVATSYRMLGTVNLKSGNAIGAREAYQKGLEITQSLTHANKADPELSGCYQKLGDVNMQLGDLLAARSAYQKLFENSSQLARDNPRILVYQQHLGIALDRLGDVNLQVGNVAAARDNYERLFEINQKLAEADPHNVEAQLGLSIGYKELGKVALQSADVSAARDAFQKSFEICQMLAQRDPHDNQAQHDFADSFTHLGDANLALGDVVAARDAYQKGLNIFSKLAQADAKDTSSQSDLADCYGRLGRLEESAEEFAAAVHWFEQGITILERLTKNETAAIQPGLKASLQDQKQAAAVCKAAPQAIDSLEFALAQPKEIVPELLGVRCRSLARRGKPQEASATADKLAALEFADGRDLFHAAAGFALCADGARAAQRQAKPSTDLTELEERYDARAVELLKQAQAKGYINDPIPRAALAADHNLDRLRRRDDFQKLLAEGDPTRQADISDPKQRGK